MMIRNPLSAHIVLTALCLISLVAVMSFPLAAQSPPVPATVTFNLVPQPKFLNCLGVAGGPTPTASVTVTRGALNDTLTLTAKNLKPDLGFDLFTIQNTNLASNGVPDPNFKNFGLSWYQSDVRTDATGSATVTIQTILLDQIFGFDAAVGVPNSTPPATVPLPPTNTFHVGFWFDNPQDAAACGFDTTAPTPFNGEHNAGPNAMISVPDSRTNLGPLCSQPVVAANGGFTCRP